MLAAATISSSGLLDPAALLVGLPVGYLEPLRLGLPPSLARRRNRVIVLAIKHQHQSLVAAGVRRHRYAVEKEADCSAIRIVLGGGEQDRLRRGFAGTGGAMRQEAVVAVGPQMRIERIDALLGAGLHHHAPAAF